MGEFRQNTPGCRREKGPSIRVFHATDPVSAVAILQEGFRLDVRHASDPGDFGLGVYFTTSIHRARAIGRVILEVFLDLENPLELSEEAAYALVLDKLGFDTIHGHGVPALRVREARKVRDWFLSRGHDTLIVKKQSGDLEVVVYDLTSIGPVTVKERR